jgi:hypothetical protein
MYETVKPDIYSSSATVATLQRLFIKGDFTPPHIYIAVNQ